MRSVNNRLNEGMFHIYILANRNIVERLHFAGRKKTRKREKSKEKRRKKLRQERGKK